MPGRIHLAALLALLVRPLREDRERGVGEALRQQRIGLVRGDPDGALPLRLRRELHIAEHPRLGRSVLRGGERPYDRLGVDGVAVLEPGVAQGELPALRPVPLPLRGERGLGGALLVDPGQPLDDGEPAERHRVVPVRRHGLRGRERHDGTQPLVTPAGRAPVGRAAAGGDGDEQRGGPEREQGTAADGVLRRLGRLGRHGRDLI